MHEASIHMEALAIMMVNSVAVPGMALRHLFVSPTSWRTPELSEPELRNAAATAKEALCIGPRH